MANLGFKLNRAKEFLLDLIFPKECLGCNREGSYLCKQCLAQVNFTEEFYCALCKKPSPEGRICQNCQKETNLKAIWVAADYNNKILQDLIHALKYNYLEEISDDLAKLIFGYLQEKNILSQFQLTPDNAVLVPVPLHQKRYLARGFNQSELLANKISKFTSIKSSGLLARQKNTETQINLKRKERQANVREAFKLKENNSDINKKIILIDDVVTTGSTLKECAKVLGDAGYREIYGLVVAQREE
jgi:competence protein ComFC